MNVDMLIEMMNAAPSGMYVSFTLPDDTLYRRTYLKRGSMWEWAWCENEIDSAESLAHWALDNDHLLFVGFSNDPRQLISPDFQWEQETTRSPL